MAKLVWRAATAFAILFWGLGKVNGTAQCNIQYENMPVLHENAARLQCTGITSASVKWWRSREQCDNFVDYTSECGGTSNLCEVRANSSYFYYCCTPSTIDDVVSARDEDRKCFRIQVCTDVSINREGSTVAFFNEPVQIFVEMFTEPQPRQNTTIFLTHTTESQKLLDDDTDYEVATVGDAKLIWQYIVQVPDLPSKPREGVLRFTATFMHINPDCPSEDLSLMIPVRRKDPPAPTEPQATTETDLEGSSTLSASERVGYQVAIGVLCVLLLLCFFSMIVAIGLTVCRYFKQRKSTRSFSDTSPYGVSPAVTPGDERPPYNREDSAASTTRLLRNNYEHSHPTTLPVRGTLPGPDSSYNGTNGRTPTSNTPTPTVQSRLLPATPDGRPSPSPTNHMAMETINEERAESSTKPPALYARVDENVPLERQQNSSAVDV